MHRPRSSQIKAMIHLLCAEESRDNRRLLREKLVDMGTACLPDLERALQKIDRDGRDRIQAVLHEIRRRGLEHQFRAWAGRSGDLEEGVFCLAQFGYPSLDVRRYRDILDEMGGEALKRIGRRRKPRDIIEVLCQFLFHDQAFRGNSANYYDPDNSYLNRVIDQRAGIPITLSVVLLLLSQRIGVPIVGIGLPGHFLTRYETPEGGFYIDAFNGGQILAGADCAQYIKNAGLAYRDEYFLPAPPAQIVARMMRNLIFVYHQLSEPERVNWLSRYVKAVG